MTKQNNDSNNYNDNSIIKSIFSSLTSRRGRYDYVLTNHAASKNHYLLSNSDISILTSYNNNKLCFHIVTIKDDKIKQICDQEYLQINDFDGEFNKHVILYCKYPVEWLSYLKNKDIFSLNIETDKFYNMYAKFYNEKKQKEDILKLGTTIDNYYATIIIQHLFETFINYSPTYKEKYCQIIDLDISELINSTKSPIYIYKLDIHKFKNSSNESIFKNYQKYISIFLFDGIDIISLREYVKKLKTSYILKLITWVENEYIKYMTYFEDDNLIVRSFRPHLCIFPLINLNKITGE